MKFFRNFLYRAKYRYGQHLPLSVPVDVSLELASQCNMACAYCYHGDPKNLPFQKGIMTFDTGERIIRQASALGVNSLKFNWKGEATLNQNFASLAEYAYRLSDGSTFIDRLTNSNFKFKTDREDIFRGLTYMTKVKVSFDSFRPEVFEKQRTLGNHALALANIDKFYNLPSRKNTELVIQAVRTQLNADEDLEHEIKKRWPEAKASIRDVVAGRNLKTETLDLLTKKRDPSTRQSCIQAHVRLIFNWRGEAFPCCPDISESLLLGNINQHSMGDIFRGAAARKLRGALKSGAAFRDEKSTCYTCPSYETFKGFKPVWNS